MEQPAVSGLDHLVIGVGDLDRARGTWQSLGFTISPRGRHPGQGTANHCIMFRRDYVELLGIVDPQAARAGLSDMLAFREGLLAVAFATADAEAARAGLARLGIETGAVRPLSRTVDTPAGELRPGFRVLSLPGSATPGIAAFLCQHLTPELVWQAAWCDHPNTAVGLAGLTAVYTDPGAVAVPFAKLFGAERVQAADGLVTVDTGGAKIHFATFGDLTRMNSDWNPLEQRPRPWLAGLSLAVADLDKATACLGAAHVPFRTEDAGRLRVNPDYTGGLLLEFVAA